MGTSSLNPFRLLLDHLDESERSDVLNYFRFVHSIGEEVVDEVANRLLRPTANRDAKLLAMETAFYHPWASWTQPVHRILRHESDEEVFEVGVRALGRAGTQEANDALRDLYSIRHEPVFQEILSWEMVRTDPQQALQTYLGRLMEGSTNPRVANEAAAELSKLANADSLPSLFVLAYHQDLLITRHALKLITSVIDPAAADWLCDYLEENHQMALTDRTLRDWLGAFRMVSGAELRDVILKELEACFGVRCPEPYATLAAAFTQDAQAQAAALDVAKEQAEGILEEFLIRVLVLSLEGKPAKVSAYLTETGEGVHLRARRTGHAIDTSALGLLHMLTNDCTGKDRVLPLLKMAYIAQTGREGVGRALGLMVEADDEETQALILSNLDSPARGAALDAAGSRDQDDLLPFLLKACRDPIEDISQRVILCLGKLQGALEAAIKLLGAQNLDDINLGINIMALNRMKGAVLPLLDYLENSNREEVSLKVAHALGQIGAAESAPRVMNLLHSGQSPRMQVALAECLRNIADPAIAFSLAERALELHQAPITVLAIEAVLHASAKTETVLDEACESMLRRLVQEVWNDRDPWSSRFRVIQCMDGLNCTHPSFYEEMAQLADAVMADKRAASVWSAEQQAIVNNTSRNLSRKAKEARTASFE